MPVSDAENRLSLMYAAGILPHAKALLMLLLLNQIHLLALFWLKYMPFSYLLCRNTRLRP